jgi:hypothetical protein
LNRCWFTAKTLKGNKDQLFSDESQSPSIEVTIRGANTHSTQSARTGYFGAGSDIPQNLFEYLSHNENFKGEQKFHVPMEDQSESAMIFKQRTIETSVKKFFFNLSLLYQNYSISLSFHFIEIVVCCQLPLP